MTKVLLQCFVILMWWLLFCSFRELRRQYVDSFNLSFLLPSSVFLSLCLLHSSCLEKENLCLYGHPNETWEVTLPAEEVPPELPEPALGINFARDGMNRKDWLSLVAVHSDSWLLSAAFYLGARLNRNER